jgi:hypothetical protein
LLKRLSLPLNVSKHSPTSVTASTRKRPNRQISRNRCAFTFFFFDCAEVALARACEARWLPTSRGRW